MERYVLTGRKTVHKQYRKNAREPWHSAEGCNLDQVKNLIVVKQISEYDRRCKRCNNAE